jgi:phosphopantothenate synthetase
MSDKIELHDTDETTKDHLQTASTTTDSSIFDEQFDRLMGDFSKACDKEQVKVAVAIAMHPDHDSPIILTRGHDYNVAMLLAQLLRELKYRLNKELEV